MTEYGKRLSISRLTPRLPAAPGMAARASGAVHTRSHSTAELLTVDQLRGARVDLGKSAHDLRVPRLFHIRIRRPVEPDHPVIRKLRALAFREIRRLGTYFSRCRVTRGPAPFTV